MKLLCCALLAGCGFSANVPGVGLGDDEPGVDSGAEPQDPQQPTATGPGCGDPTMRLCIDFEQMSPIRDEAGGAPHSTNVVQIARLTERAARFTQGSVIQVQERTGLDISPNLTIELWAKPTARPADNAQMVLLDNAQQYGLAYDDNGDFECELAGATVDAAGGAENQWHHVACTYDGAELRIYVDGNVAGCTSVAGAIGQGGAFGLAIGAQRALLTYANHLVGELDDVHVFARTFTPAEICSVAGVAAGACTATCPPRDD